jgi:hypothetical protein
LRALFVPGVGWDCVGEWLGLKGTEAAHVRQFGYDLVALKVDALSSSDNNARQIRDAIVAMGPADGEPDIVLIGFSKGAPDILQAIVSYPEIHEQIAAVVSMAGAIDGSPLANDATQSQLNMLQHQADADCTPGDGGALESLRSATRKKWLSRDIAELAIALRSGAMPGLPAAALIPLIYKLAP